MSSIDVAMQQDITRLPRDPVPLRHTGAKRIRHRDRIILNA
jgi:hypothetical protein